MINDYSGMIWSFRAQILVGIASIRRIDEMTGALGPHCWRFCGLSTPFYSFIPFSPSFLFLDSAIYPLTRLLAPGITCTHTHQYTSPHHLEPSLLVSIMDAYADKNSRTPVASSPVPCRRGVTFGKKKKKKEHAVMRPWCINGGIQQRAPQGITIFISLQDAA